MRKKESKSKVSVIGGGGHVGLGMCLVLTKVGHTVYCIDKDEDRLNEISSGNMPFTEEGGTRLLEKALQNDLLKFSTNLEPVSDSDVIVVVIGTPIDKHNNPEMKNFLNLIENLKEYLTEGQLIILRSTIYPNTTKIVKEKIKNKGFSVGDDIYLVFAPERVAQHRAIEEMINLPQLIGSFEEESFRQAKKFFNTYLESECLKLSPTEGELGKLFTNMWRYIKFAVANEFYLIGESFRDDEELNVNEILDKTAKNYPRFNPPSPGANVGGPCLTKDGWFLVDNIPYDEMISAAFNINEGIPNSIINRMEEEKEMPNKISLLGMTFKRDSDDIRDSVAFKFKKRLDIKHHDSDLKKIDPNLEEHDDLDDLEGSDWVILVTPHSEFEDLEKIVAMIDNPDCLICDIWGLWDEKKYDSKNGLFYAKEV